IEWDGSQARCRERLFTAPVRWVSVREHVEASADPERLAAGFAASLRRCNVHSNEHLWLCRCVCDGAAADLVPLRRADAVSRLTDVLKQEVGEWDRPVTCLFDVVLRPQASCAVRRSATAGSPTGVASHPQAEAAETIGDGRRDTGGVSERTSSPRPAARAVSADGAPDELRAAALAAMQRFLAATCADATPLRSRIERAMAELHARNENDTAGGQWASAVPVPRPEECAAWAELFARSWLEHGGPSTDGAPEADPAAA
ncbi:MAG: hypothetical protein D6725_15420, partial [Planctomycetota bacterium]